MDEENAVRGPGRLNAEQIRERIRQFPVTTVLVAINAAVFLLEAALGGSRDLRVALLFGAQATPYLREGQYWRLLTAMFLHFGILHLACNMLCLMHLGPIIERVYGRVRYLVIYLGAGLIGNLLTWVLELRTGDYAVSAGASGAIFGLFGACIALALIPAMRRFLSVRGIVGTLVINLAYGITYSNVNMAAHFGGFAGGAAIAAVMILGLKRRWNMSG